MLEAKDEKEMRVSVERRWGTGESSQQRLKLGLGCGWGMDVAYSAC